MRYILNNSLVCKHTKDNNLIITAPNIGVLTIEEGQEIVCDFLEIFLTPHTFEEGFELINLKHYIDETHFTEYFDIFISNNILKIYNETTSSNLSNYHLEKYKRQIDSFASLSGIEREDATLIQKRLCECCVCVIGIGGTGSHLALTLASIGVENLILVDHDKIELSNTSRQILYTEKDIGQYKIDVAKQRLKQYNSRLEVTTYNINIQSEKDLYFLSQHHIDLLILCADTPRGEIQYFVDRSTQENNIPWFCYGPYQPSQILVGPYIVPGKTKSYEEMFPRIFSEDNESINKINSNYVAAVCDPYNGFASQFAAIEALKILSGVQSTSLFNRRYYIDTDEWSLDFIKYD